jgi:hypothetical protein
LAQHITIVKEDRLRKFSRLDFDLEEVGSSEWEDWKPQI